jgi:hypothetical protein
MTVEPFSDDASGYRPVSGLAVAAFAAGCGSAIVLFTTLAAVLPLVAIALAIAALADLRRAEGRRAGRLAALAGLALAIGFTTQAVAGAAVERWIAARRATATAEAWIEAVREGEFNQAIGMCSGGALPAAGGDPFEPPASETERLAAFRAVPAVGIVAACGAVRPAVDVERDPDIETGWVARVDLAGCGSEGRLTLRVEPRASRRGRTPIDRWLVTSLELDR